jgi:outer membrane protein
MPMRFPDMLDDPLTTNPPALESGLVLAGDDTPVVCPPQVDLAQPLVLADAVDLALCHNPQVRVAWAAIKIQAGALGEARAAYLPTLTGTMSRLKTRTRYPESPSADTAVTGNTAYAGLGWRLFDFGGRAANLDAAQQTLPKQTSCA